jgi:hypothetical protein
MNLGPHQNYEPAVHHPPDYRYWDWVGGAGVPLCSSAPLVITAVPHLCPVNSTQEGVKDELHQVRTFSLPFPPAFRHSLLRRSCLICFLYIIFYSHFLSSLFSSFFLFFLFPFVFFPTILVYLSFLIVYFFFVFPLFNNLFQYFFILSTLSCVRFSILLSRLTSIL